MSNNYLPSSIYGYTIEDLEKILDDVIEVYRTSNRVAYHPLIEKRCKLKKHNWAYYRRTDDEKYDGIRERFIILRDMQESKIIDGGMMGEYNPTMSIFLLKAKHNAIEEQHRKRLELEFGTDDVNVPDTLEIGFDDDETED